MDGPALQTATGMPKILRNARPPCVFQSQDLFQRRKRCDNRSSTQAHLPVHESKFQRRVVVQASPKDEEEVLPWERKEKLDKLAKDAGGLPFGVYLLGAAIIAIAAVGSIFEIVNKNPIFGLVQPDSPAWLPILGFFALTGIPSAGFLFLKAINSANEEADRQNKADGF